MHAPNLGPKPQAAVAHDLRFAGIEHIAIMSVIDGSAASVWPMTLGTFPARSMLDHLAPAIDHSRQGSLRLTMMAGVGRGKTVKT
jgi:hypothetical protein